MDKIRLEVQQVIDEDYGRSFSEVAIFINDRNLIDILRQIELPFAKKEAHPDIAGSYAGLVPEMIFWPSRYFLGEPAVGDKIDVLQCVCRSKGCWPFSVRITVDDDKVIWDQFSQPHRTKTHPSGGWQYDKYEPFVFDKNQYMSQLRQVSIELKADYQSRVNIYYDPKLGWFLRTYAPFFYFPKTAATLRIGKQEHLCQIINLKRKWWMVWPISETAGEWKIDQWEEVKRVIYLPQSPLAIYDWLNQYLDVSEHLDSCKKRLASVQIQNIDGICLHAALAATIKEKWSNL